MLRKALIRAAKTLIIPRSGIYTAGTLGEMCPKICCNMLIKKAFDKNKKNMYNNPMMNDINLLKEIADKELNDPQWAVTRQFLEVNSIELLDNEYVYERYSTDNTKSIFGDINNIIEKYCYEIVFYYKIKGERYFYCIGVNINEKEITRVFICESCYCYLSAYSEDMTLQEMARLTKLKYFNGGTKGEKINRGRGFYSGSWIEYKFTNNESYFLEDALNMLLDELEKDKNGIKKLVKKTNASIQIVKYQYISANAGIDINKETIKRLYKLNLSFSIDMYICGEKFIS
jgi:hypothetical protein